MSRVLLGATLALWPSSAVWAEPTITQSETLIRLKVHPMAAPKPALRYQLLPDLKEQTPGNPIPNYLKTLLYHDSPNPQQMPSRAALLQVDRAARMDKPDWQILQKVQTEGFGLLLPDVQKMRSLAAGLQDRFRTEIAENRLDDALITAKTMFAMSRHMSEHPTLIGELVGMAIAQVAIAPFEEMLEKPGCPNFYWALTSLPTPLVAFDKGIDGERALFQSEMRDLDETSPMTVESVKKFAERIDKFYAFDGGKKRKPTWEYLKEKSGDAKWVEAARKRLIEAGFEDDRLRQLPAIQVIMLDEKREFEVRRDEYTKLYPLPTWQVEEQLAKLKPWSDDGLLGFFLPATHKVRRAQGRLEQRIALLRHVEALRLYAAEHDGKLPAKLSDVTVPLPNDPFTAKPFRYSLEGETAHLRGSPPAAEARTAGYNVHYELTIKK